MRTTAGPQVVYLEISLYLRALTTHLTELPFGPWAQAVVSVSRLRFDPGVANLLRVVDLYVGNVRLWPSMGGIIGTLLPEVQFPVELIGPAPPETAASAFLELESHAMTDISVWGVLELRLEEHPPVDVLRRHSELCDEQAHRRRTEEEETFERRRSRTSWTARAEGDDY